jgi:hypothetical protein
MAINDLVKNVKAARELVATLVTLDVKPPVRAKLADAERKLGAVLLSLGDFRDDMFALQEQNQQLRKDLANRVCPRLCGHPRACAT